MKFRLYKNFIRLVFISCCTLIFLCSLAEEIVFIPPTVKENIRHLFPEGWAFFTKDPIEDLYLCYKISNNNTVLVLKKNASIDNWFGLSRRTRFIAFETGRLIEKISFSKEWNDSTGVYNGFIPENKIEIQLDIPLNHFKTGEEFVFIRYKPLPWAYNGRGQEKYRPYQYIRLKLIINA